MADPHLPPPDEIKCELCDGCGWVCENHPSRPWEGDRACTCGGAGSPCPWCNPADAETPPRLPSG
jgi:hypothetical protein